MLSEKIIENPIKSTISILTLLSMLIGTVLTVDSRYAKAEDIKHYQQSQEQYFERSRQDTNKSIDQLRKQNLEDKIFEIELIPPRKRTQSDIARLEKYKRDVQEISSKWMNK